MILGGGGAGNNLTSLLLKRDNSVSVLGFRDAKLLIPNSLVSTRRGRLVNRVILRMKSLWTKNKDVQIPKELLPKL